MKRNNLSPLTFLCMFTLLALGAGHALPAEPDAKGMQFFEKQIRPVLVEHCYACHSVEAKKAKGGLQLDTRGGLREGGDSGPAVVPGNPSESLILKAVRHEGPKMPNKGEKLSDEIIGSFETWIQMGAPDPREGKSQVQKKIDYVEGRKHWAYQPVRVTPPPRLKDAAWAQGEIDRYILARIEEKGLRPAPAAARHALMRRVTFDLIGLPPTPEEVDAFLADHSPDAFAKVVDRLLMSKEFGAHWARHWFDGIRFNPGILPVDRYRSWVIRAYNEDLPYDQFVVRQLAGDLLPAKDDQAYDDNLTASQLLCMNMREPDLAESMIEVVGQHFLAVSINCAKCHDHKYDTFAQTDYYALAGIFASTRIGGFQGRTQLMRKAQGTPLRAEPGVSIPVTQDGKKAVDVSLLINGEPKQKGAVVPRQFPVVLAGDSQKPLREITQGSGRLELAHWIADPQNPLTARVMVNRVWQRLLGRGIVATPNDFGTQGDRPTHPELLDYLADRFVKSGWSTKTMIREIVLSRTYRQGTRTSPEIRKADLENTLFTRAPSKRLQFEQIIDSLYFVAGRLNLEEPSPDAASKPVPGKAAENPYRAIFGQTPASPRLFDGPNPQEIVPKREASITSPQLLFFFNNPSVIKLADAVAKRAAESSDSKANVTRAYRLLYARVPTDQELAHATQYLQRNNFARYCQVLLCAHEFIYLD